MRIETHLAAAGTLAVPGPTDQNRGDAFGLFADHLDEQMAKAANAADVRDSRSDGPSEDDVAVIREKGYVGYFEELRAKRIEELREEILASMGITEEDLAKMPPENRAAIEKMVFEEIQKRLAAEAVVDNGNDKKPDQGMREQAMTGKELGFGCLFALGKPRETDPLAPRQGDEDR